MEQARYLTDSNAVIDFLGRKMPLSGMKFMAGVIDATPNVSIITKIEILAFNAPEEHYTLLLNFMADANVLDLTSKVADMSINIRKSYKIKLPDAIIAATALVYNLELITRNTTDFKAVKGMKLLNPHNL